MNAPATAARPATTNPAGPGIIDNADPTEEIAIIGPEIFLATSPSTPSWPDAIISPLEAAIPIMPSCPPAAEAFIFAPADIAICFALSPMLMAVCFADVASCFIELTILVLNFLTEFAVLIPNSFTAIDAVFIPLVVVFIAALSMFIGLSICAVSSSFAPLANCSSLPLRIFVPPYAPI